MNQEKTPASEAVSQRAYGLWEQAGRPPGRDQEFWLRAEAELAAGGGATSGPRMIEPPAARPAAARATAVHEIPPPIKDAVKLTNRRAAPSRRVPKRA